MTEINVLNEVPVETWERIAPEVTLTQLDQLQGSGVNIQCINSSDFVIGRQTNFNGPVTIISCADILKQINQEKKPEDDVVIKDKVLSQSAAMKVQKLATEVDQGAEQPSRFGKLKQAYWVLVLVCLGLGAFFALSSLQTTETQLPKCTHLANNFCIYSDFDWGGRRISNGKPLRTPVSHVIISQTYQEFCYDVATCLNEVKLFQVNRTEDTTCNFLIGGDGNAYEDVGWDWESSLQGPASGRAVQICLMGNHSDDYPTYPQLATVKVLVRFGVDGDHISGDYTLAASNATSPGRCLGAIYGIINKWDNFSENPFSLPPDSKC